MVGYTHSKRKKPRNRLCQYKKHQTEQLICQVSLALPAHIPVLQVFLSPGLLYERAAQSRGELPGGAHSQQLVEVPRPLLQTLPVFPDLGATCRKKPPNKDTLRWKWWGLSQPCALVAELGLCLGLVSSGAQGMWRWPWCKHPLFPQSTAGLGAVCSPAIAHSLMYTFLTVLVRDVSMCFNAF